MENECKAVIPANITPEQPTRGIFVPESQENEWFYGQMAKHQAGFNSNYLTAADSLETLYNRTCRLNRLFISLNRPWVSGCGDIQKACAYYLTHAGLTKEKQEAFIHVQGDIAYTICHLAACSDFIAQMQRCFRNQEKELRQLLDLQKESRQQEKTETC